MVTESGKLVCGHIHKSIVQIRVQQQKQNKKDTVSGDKKKIQSSAKYITKCINKTKKENGIFSLPD